MVFQKLHGLGNDYIYVNAIKETIDNPEELAVKLSKRHFGVGADGLILIKASNQADFKMEMYNADGTQAEMCGNGIRCLGKYVYDNKLTDKKALSIETLSGIKKLQLEVENEEVKMVSVDMGKPIWQPRKIPVISDKNLFMAEPIHVQEQIYYVTAVSIGNPHAVIFVKEFDEIAIDKVGDLVEHSSIFPNRTNVEFVKVISEHNIQVRVWERGSGMTLACGTGACAAVAASIIHGYTKPEVEVLLDGGKLHVSWNSKTNHLWMSGPAEYVFEGSIDS